MGYRVLDLEYWYWDRGIAFIRNVGEVSFQNKLVYTESFKVRFESVQQHCTSALDECSDFTVERKFSSETSL